MKKKREGFVGERLYRLPVEDRNRAITLPASRSCLITDVGFFPEASGHEVQRPLGYSSHVFLFCVAGEGWVSFGEEHLSLSAGEICWIAPHIPHSYGSAASDPWRVYWLHMEGSRVDAWWEWFSNEQDDGVRWKVTEYFLLAERFEQVWRFQDEAGSDASLIRMSMAGEALLVDAMLRKEAQDASSRQIEERIDRSVHWMREHLGEKVRLSECAQAAGMSLSHYSAVFRKVTGSAPMHYFNRLRLRQGGEWLSTTSLSVQEISDQLGYANSFHFSKAFKQFSGVSPREYRNKL